MFDCGIDFGSTYTIISICREGRPEAVLLTEGALSASVPTVMAIDKKGKKQFGHAAKNLTGKKGCQVYKAFKMLLAEQDEELLAERGFGGEVSPQTAAREFLQEMLRMAAERVGDTQIGNLVVGAPEIWFKDMKTLEARSILAELCREITGVEIKHVMVVSEPAAACAYFVYNYQNEMKRPFKGSIFLADYGGGTLDNSLTQVAVDTDPDGRQSMSIKVLESNGAGEVAEGKIGKAGIVYMETVVREAILRSGVLDGEEFRPDGDFYRAVNQLESELQNQVTAINQTFRDIGIDDLEELDEEEFTALDYRREEIIVTYALLAEIYDRVIRDVFGEKLREMIGFMDRHGINYLNTERDDFKLALVGGFGNYYLVRKQMTDTFKLANEGDNRGKGIIVNRSDCEMAISYGTALLAAGLVKISQTAPFSIAPGHKRSDGGYYLDYAFRYKQDISYNVTYFPKNQNGHVIPTMVAADQIEDLIINFGHEDERAMVVPLKTEFRRKLTNLNLGQYHVGVLGFSLDATEVLTLHVHEYDYKEKTAGREIGSYRLARYSELFELTRLRNAIS